MVSHEISPMCNAFTVCRMDQQSLLSLASEFVVKYYTVMKKCPSSLHRFYKDDSSMVHGNDTIFTQRLIHEKIMSMDLRECYVGILQLDALRALDNCVLIQVAGEIGFSDTELRRFTQSFILREQAPYDFYVLNDIFRFQDQVYGDIQSSDLTESESADTELSDHPTKSVTPMPICSMTNGDHEISTWNPTVSSDHTRMDADINLMEANHIQHTKQRDIVDMSELEFSQVSSLNPINPPPSDIPVTDPPRQSSSWAEMVSKQPMRNTVPPIKPNRGQLVNYTQDDEMKTRRSGIQGNVGNRRSRGGRDQPLPDERSVTGDHPPAPYFFDNRPTNQGQFRPGRGAPNMNVRGRGSRGTVGRGGPFIRRGN